MHAPPPSPPILAPTADPGRYRRALFNRRGAALVALALAAVALAPAPPAAAALTDELGRSDVRVRSAPYPIAAGLTVTSAALPERLDRLGYRRVHRLPAEPGEFFWGRDVFWIYRRGFRSGGAERPAALFGLELSSGGRIAGAIDAERAPLALDGPGGPRLALEPETLAESLTADRAPRLPVRLDELPERVWRPLLAAEDARFFEHGGLDARALARAALANVLAGGVEQGGSTLTQQLVKMRDLTPRRTVGRKLSEAMRALALEAEHDKPEILEAYLDHVYYGHFDGVGIYGLGAAARAYFGKPAAELTLGEAALLAAVIQGPNRLSPVRHLDRAVARQRWVLDRVEQLGWAEPAALAEARRRPPVLRIRRPERRRADDTVRWAAEIARDAAPHRLGRGRGVVIETTLDPQLQRLAERAVADGLAELRRARPGLAGRPLQAALVALDAATGEVLAQVGGDPADPEDRFDRVREARRQPGSAVKPLVLLEAFDRCDDREPLFPGSRVADEPIELEVPGGPWRPANPDGTYRGVVTVREALARSLNVPFVRMARWCGWRATAGRARLAGLELPDEPPPSFVLGSLGTSPLRLAEAFTVFATPGVALRPWPVARIERPGGGALASGTPGPTRVVAPASAWLVRDAMRTAVAEGTAGTAAIPGADVAAKTGTSTGGRDAWLAGDAGSVVTVVWVGLDDDAPARLGGASAAAPIWRRFMAAAVAARPPRPVPRPDDVVEGWLEPETGLRVRPERRGAVPELFRRGALPPHRRLLRPDRPEPVVR
jgi:membrane peptidoglycan carboxypeptidase